MNREMEGGGDGRRWGSGTEGERGVFSLKLQGLQETQQRQAHLVQRLQAKVIHYKNQCVELEQRLLEKENSRHLEKVEGERLEREISHEEKVELETALEKGRTCWSLRYDRLRLEDLRLKDSLVKTCALNESLANDKEILKNIILKMEVDAEGNARLLSSLEGAREEGERRLLEVNEDQREMEGRIRLLEGERERMEGELQRSEGEMEAWREMEARLKEQLMQTTAETSSLKEELHRSQQKLLEARDSSTAVQRGLEREARMRGEMEVKMSVLQNETVSLQRELGALRTSQSLVETSLYDEIEKVSLRDSQLHSVQRELQSLNQAKVSLTERLSLFQRAQEQEKREWERKLNQEIVACRSEILKVHQSEQEKVQDEQGRVSDLQRQVELALREAERYQHELEEQKVAMERERKTHESTQSEQTHNLETVKLSLADEIEIRERMELAWSEEKESLMGQGLREIQGLDQTRASLASKLASAQRQAESLALDLLQARQEAVEARAATREREEEKEEVSRVVEEMRGALTSLETDRVRLSLLIEEHSLNALVLEDSLTGLRKEAQSLRKERELEEKSRLDSQREIQDLQRKLKVRENDLSGSGRELGTFRKAAERRETNLVVEIERLSGRLEETKSALKSAEEKASSVEGKLLESEAASLGLEGSLSDQASARREREKELEAALDRLGVRLRAQSLGEAGLRLELSAERGRAEGLSLTLARALEQGRRAHGRLHGLLSLLRKNLGFGPTPVTLGNRSLKDDTNSNDLESNLAEKRTEGEREEGEREDGEREDGEKEETEIKMVENSLNELLQRENNVRKEKDRLQGEFHKLRLDVGRLEMERVSTVGQLERMNRRLEESEDNHRKACEKLMASRSTSRLQQEASQRSVRERAELKETIVHLQRALRKTETEMAGPERESDGSPSLSLHDLSLSRPLESLDEISHLRSSKKRLEVTLESREREHQERMKDLQEQVSVLKSHLSQDLSHRRRFVSDSGRVSRRLWRLRSELGLSLRALSLDPDLSTLDTEAWRLQLSLRGLHQDSPRSATSPGLYPRLSKSPLPSTPSGGT